MTSNAVQKKLNDVLMDTENMLQKYFGVVNVTQEVKDRMIRMNALSDEIVVLCKDAVSKARGGDVEEANEIMSRVHILRAQLRTLRMQHRSAYVV